MCSNRKGEKSILSFEIDFSESIIVNIVILWFGVRPQSFYMFNNHLIFKMNSFSPLCHQLSSSTELIRYVASVGVLLRSLLDVNLRIPFR